MYSNLPIFTTCGSPTFPLEPIKVTSLDFPSDDTVIIKALLDDLALYFFPETTSLTPLIGCSGKTNCPPPTLYKDLNISGCVASLSTFPCNLSAIRMYCPSNGVEMVVPSFVMVIFMAPLVGLFMAYNRL